MKEFQEEFWKETSKLMDAHRKDNDERAAQGVVDCRILFTRLVKNLTIPRVSNSVCPINSAIKQDKCIYRGDKCRVCLDD
jgi:hypothetical protein